MSTEIPTHAAYIFERVRRMPRTREEYFEIPFILLQRTGLSRFRTAMGLASPMFFDALSTNSKAMFHKDRKFVMAVEAARAFGTPLLLHDINEHLSRVPPLEYPTCIEDLMACGVEILDTLTGRKLSERTALDQIIVRERMAKRLKRSTAVKAGLSDRPISSDAPRGRTKGPEGNIRKAKISAIRLRPFVDELRLSLPSGTILGATELMKELNASGRLTDRGKSWSYNSANNLLKVLGTLPSEVN